MDEEKEAPPKVESTDSPEATTIAQKNFIVAQDLIDKFNVVLRDIVSSAASWHNTNIPTNNNTTGDPWFPSGGSWVGGSAADIISNADRGGPTVNDLLVPEPGIIALTIANAFSYWTKKYTATRYLSWTRIYQQSANTYGGDRWDTPGWSAPYMTSLTPEYEQQHATIDAQAAAYNIKAGEKITAENLNSYITALYNIWNSAKNNTVSYTTYHCHSSCHSPCHGNRTWR